MATKTMRRGLGRGLSALIPESDFDLLNIVARGEIAPLPTQQNATASDGSAPTPASSTFPIQEGAAVVPAGDIRYLAIENIEANPFQPRQNFSEEELENLAASVREHGVLQPILVRPLPAPASGTTSGTASGTTSGTASGSNVERFQLIAGERRWRAATRAGLTQVPAIVRAVDDKSALELAIIENVQRHDISSVESAQAYRRLAREFGLSQDAISARVGKSRASVANTMRLLDLPEEALGALRDNKISEGHGRALLTAAGDSARRSLLRSTLRDGLSVRELERRARDSNLADAPQKAEATARLSRASSPDLARLETSLQRALGAKLKLKSRRRGGQIVIDFASPEELSRLIKRMTKPGEIETETNANANGKANANAV